MRIPSTIMLVIFSASLTFATHLVVLSQTSTVNMFPISPSCFLYLIYGSWSTTFIVMTIPSSDLDKISLSEGIWKFYIICAYELSNRNCLGKYCQDHHVKLWQTYMNWIAQSHIILKCHKLCMTIEREARYELHGIILNVKNRSKKRKSHRAICNIKNTRTLQ